MYEINSDNEILVQSKGLYIKRRGSRSLHFRLHETIAPAVDEKYVAFPAPLQEVDEPKPEYVVRGNNEIDVINQFISLTRNVKRFHYMFRDSNRNAGE